MFPDELAWGRQPAKAARPEQLPEQLPERPEVDSRPPVPSPARQPAKAARPEQWREQLPEGPAVDSKPPAPSPARLVNARVTGHADAEANCPR
ncbi:hypothetical protein T484DRAFT_1919855 [Baffinella frigidus]|nr:hypothetical protein T484DRAFT_1919855 [Cryptophyta sp. CCMP2293]